MCRLAISALLLVAGSGIAIGARSAAWVVGDFDNHGRLTAQWGPDGVELCDRAWPRPCDEHYEGSVRLGAESSALTACVRIGLWAADAVVIVLALIVAISGMPLRRVARIAIVGLVGVAAIALDYEWSARSRRPSLGFADWNPAVDATRAGAACFVGLAGLLLAIAALYPLARRGRQAATWTRSSITAPAYKRAKSSSTAA